MADFIFEVTRKIWIKADDEADAQRKAARATWDNNYAMNNDVSGALEPPKITCEFAPKPATTKPTVQPPENGGENGK